MVSTYEAWIEPWENHLQQTGYVVREAGGDVESHKAICGGRAMYPGPEKGSLVVESGRLCSSKGLLRSLPSHRHLCSVTWALPIKSWGLFLPPLT